MTNTGVEMSDTRKPLTKLTIIAAIKKHQAVIADARDKLRALVADVEEVCQDSDEAVGELELAVEYLSRNL
jgi:hypothetical protein